MVGPPSTAFGLLPVHVYAALSSLFDSKCRLPPVTTPVLHRCLRSFPFPQALSIGYPCLWVGSQGHWDLRSSLVILVPLPSGGGGRSNESRPRVYSGYYRFEYLFNPLMGSLISGVNRGHECANSSHGR